MWRPRLYQEYNIQIFIVHQNFHFFHKLIQNEIKWNKITHFSFFVDFQFHSFNYFLFQWVKIRGRKEEEMDKNK